MYVVDKSAAVPVVRGIDNTAVCAARNHDDASRIAAALNLLVMIEDFYPELILEGQDADMIKVDPAVLSNDIVTALGDGYEY